jgi:hypothetical protein
MSLLFSHPIKKLTLLAAFGGGYVLGAKAGRERYEQIKQVAQQVADDPRVQQATSQAQGLVQDAAEKVKDDSRVKDVTDKVEDAVDTATSATSDAVSDAEPGNTSQAAPVPTPPPPPATDDVHPLLVDEHVGLENTVVYSAGPDVEESIDDLTGDAPRNQ